MNTASSSFTFSLRSAVFAFCTSASSHVDPAGDERLQFFADQLPADFAPRIRPAGMGGRCTLQELAVPASSR